LKRIVKLKGELILAICISAIAGIIIAFIVSGVYREITLNDDKLITMANEKNNKEIEKIKNRLQIDSKSESIVYENIKRIEKILQQSFVNRIFIVDNEGYVKNSTGKLGIKQIDLSQGTGSNIIISNNKYIATNIIKLNEQHYVVYLNENNIYDDMIIFRVASIAIIILFLILISGRVRYISNIAKNVKIIATGNFSNRITLKYKNELTDLAEDINYMAQELQQQELNQKEFITNISHDLRTPLTTILGYSKMLEQKVYSNEEDLERYVSIINKKGNYLKTMMDDFFDYAKLSSKDMSLEKVVINLNELIMQLLDGEEFRFKEKDLKLDVLLQNKAMNIYGDSMLIARALSNLINNALRYSKQATVVNISLEEKRINEINYGVFSIDNIPSSNLSEKEVHNLFKRLYKVDKSRNEQGSGLGLVITQEIIKAHNGFIEAKLIEERIRFIVMLNSNSL